VSRNKWSFGDGEISDIIRKHRKAFGFWLRRATNLEVSAGSRFDTRNLILKCFQMTVSEPSYIYLVVA